MNKLLEFGEKLSTWASWIGGSILFATSIMIAVEVILRKGFSITIGGADEISSYALAVSCSWTFGYALFRKSHIRIDVLYVHLPRLFRYVLDVVSLLFFGLYMVILSYFAFVVLSTSIEKHSVANTPLATPLWIPQSLWFIGLLGFTLTIILLLTATVYSLLKRDFQRARQISGASTLDEEIEEETRATVASTDERDI